MKNITTWDRIRVFFHDSETIVLARLQVFVGVIFGIVTMVDPSLITGVLPVKYIPYWLLASGIITELVRRSRAPHNLGVVDASDLGTVMVPVKVEDAVVVDKAAGTVTIAKAAAIPDDIATKKSGDAM